jgi:hypothetical protein
VDIADSILITSHLFRGAVLSCFLAADANDDEKVDLGDSIRLISYLFHQGPPPSSPFPGTGEDPTPGSLTCAH